MKLKIFTILIIFMFFSKKGFSENYDKVLYDFKIESITGEIIDLNKFRNKVILITNTVIVVLLNIFLIYKSCGKNIKKKVLLF